MGLFKRNNLFDYEEGYLSWAIDYLIKHDFLLKPEETAKKLLTDSIEEARNINLRGKIGWNYYKNDHQFMYKRKEAGLSEDDIKNFWDREVVLINLEYRLMNVVSDAHERFPIYKQLVNSGVDRDSAIKIVRKSFPYFGDPGLSHVNFQGDDSDIYPEFQARYYKWKEKTSTDVFRSLSEQYNTLNAMIRFLIKKGVI